MSKIGDDIMWKDDLIKKLYNTATVVNLTDKKSDAEIMDLINGEIFQIVNIQGHNLCGRFFNENHEYFSKSATLNQANFLWVSYAFTTFLGLGIAYFIDKDPKISPEDAYNKVIDGKGFSCVDEFVLPLVFGDNKVTESKLKIVNGATPKAIDLFTDFMRNESQDVARKVMMTLDDPANGVIAVTEGVRAFYEFGLLFYRTSRLIKK